MAVWILIGFVALVLYCIKISMDKNAYWKAKGVPGLNNYPVIGRFLEVMSLGQGKFDLKFTKEVGRIFAYFDGSIPVVVTSDTEMIKSVMIKDFSHFVGRRTLDLNGPLLSNSVTVLTHQHWKDVRGVLVPAFSSGKMRQMNDLINESCEVLMDNLSKIAGERREFEAKQVFGAAIMDVVATTFFGTKIDSQNNPNDPFVKNAQEAFNQPIPNPLVVIAFLFPKTAPLMKKLGVQFIPKRITQFFVDNTKQILEMRLQSKEVRRDFLQLMLNSLQGSHNSTNVTKEKRDNEEDGEVDVLSEHLAENQDGGKTRLRSDYKMTQDELVAQAVVFFIAGYETTATALAFFTHVMATHQDIQDRLRREIEEVMGDETRPTYDLLARMDYLDMCLNETLRMYPPVSRTERECNEDWEFRGVKYEKGTIVGIPIYAMQHDPEYWPEPEVFNPERFSKENKHKIKPYSFLTFGSGPRMCLGMRFAFFEMKMVIASMLRTYRIVPTARTEIPLVLKDVVMVTAKNGVWITIEKI